VECAFGEIDRRWGILWKALEGELSGHKYTIDSCLRLHNFIVEYRLSKEKTTEEDSYELQELERASNDFYGSNPLETPGVYAEDVLDTVVGRPTCRETMLREHGKQLRDRLCKGLENAGMARPTSGGKSSSAHHDRYNRMVCNEK